MFDVFGIPVTEQDDDDNMGDLMGTFQAAGMDDDELDELMGTFQAAGEEDDFGFDLDDNDLDDNDFDDNDFDDNDFDDNDFDDNDFDDNDFDDDDFDDNDFDDDDFDDDDFDDDDFDDDDFDDDDFDDDDDDVLYAFDEDDEFFVPQAELGEAESYTNFDPEDMDESEVLGDVVADMELWHEQEGNTCAINAQEFALEGLTGREFDTDELTELATEMGWFCEEGTALDDVGNILEYYGLDVEKSFNTSVEDMENCLENGGKVIVCVDADELWSGENEELFFPGRDSNHALQLVGFDYSDSDEPMAILNDSGVANGCGAMVPLDDFMDAFEDSNCFAVMAYADEKGEF